MSERIAKRGDRVVGLDTHVILVSSPGGAVPTPMPMPFDGPIAGNCSTAVFLDHQPVALVDSTADNAPPHIPTNGPFQRPPTNRGTITQGSTTLFIEHRAVARNNDPARCCNDPVDQETGHVVVPSGTAFAK